MYKNNGNEKKAPYIKKKMAIKDYIFFLLARREYSYKEIKTKLIKREYPSDDIVKTLDWMVSENYQSDERMAKSFYNTYKNKYGKYIISQKLFMKGIDKKIIDEVLNENQDEDFEIEIAYKIIERYKNEDLSDFKLKDKLIRKIVSKGFSFDIAKEAYLKLSKKNLDL